MIVGELVALIGGRMKNRVTIGIKQYIFVVSATRVPFQDLSK